MEAGAPVARRRGRESEERRRWHLLQMMGALRRAHPDSSLYQLAGVVAKSPQGKAESLRSTLRGNDDDDDDNSLQRWLQRRFRTNQDRLRREADGWRDILEAAARFQQSPTVRAIHEMLLQFQAGLRANVLPAVVAFLRSPEAAALVAAAEMQRHLPDAPPPPPPPPEPPEPEPPPI